PFVTSALCAALGSGVAAFLARRHAIWAGVLANSVFALVVLARLVLAVTGDNAELVGNLSYQLYEFLLFSTVVLASISGAAIGRGAYSGERDLDLTQQKIPIF